MVQRYSSPQGITTGATATALGTGAANTATIIAVQGVTGNSYAARLAHDFHGGGYTDWFLPSKDELNALYVSRAMVGGFSDYGDYWSSTEVSDITAWGQYFFNGVQVPDDYKNYQGRVRAVRAF